MSTKAKVVNNIQQSIGLVTGLDQKRQLSLWKRKKRRLKKALFASSLDNKREQTEPHVEWDWVTLQMQDRQETPQWGHIYRSMKGRILATKASSVCSAWLHRMFDPVTCKRQSLIASACVVSHVPQEQTQTYVDTYKEQERSRGYWWASSITNIEHHHYDSCRPKTERSVMISIGWLSNIQSSKPVLSKKVQRGCLWPSPGKE